jgi:hypothetical protein
MCKIIPLQDDEEGNEDGCRVVGMVILKIDVVYECMVVHGVCDTIERSF